VVTFLGWVLFRRSLAGTDGWRAANYAFLAAAIFELAFSAFVLYLVYGLVRAGVA